MASSPSSSDSSLPPAPSSPAKSDALPAPWLEDEIEAMMRQEFARRVELNRTGDLGDVVAGR